PPIAACRSRRCRPGTAARRPASGGGSRPARRRRSARPPARRPPAPAPCTRGSRPPPRRAERAREPEVEHLHLTVVAQEALGCDQEPNAVNLDELADVGEEVQGGPSGTVELED